MKPVSEYRDRIQFVVRLTQEDYEKFKIKAHADQLSFQRITETLVLEYLRDNRHVMKILAPLERSKPNRRRVVTDDDARRITDLLERESPLQDIVVTKEP